MATPPTSRTRDVFRRSFDGVHGRFKTAQSFELDYLLTSIKVSQLGDLETAASALPLKDIDFEQVIQRDIDWDRVDGQLVAKYLEAGKGRVVFFPPLLVSLVAFGENGEAIKRYEGVDSDVNNSELVKTWDKDKFQLVLPIAEQATGYTVTDKGETYNYYHYAATLRTNPENVKLVVIDGQHRFAALQRIMERPEKRDLIKNVDLPLCIIFTPGAVRNNEGEEILRDLRELFVTVNNEAKRVSGHFFVLLRDNLLSSVAIRCLANSWKNQTEGPIGSRLLFLEWNTREERRAYQRMKKHSVTTVSILADCLGEHVFSNSGLTQSLLNLSEVREDLQISEESRDYTSISEKEFDLDQTEVIRAQVNRYLVPALTTLLLEPRPYKALRNSVANAINELNEKIDRNELGALQFRDDVLYQFRKCTERDPAAIRTAEGVFEQSVVDQQEEAYEVYFLAVFQQGLLRAWADVCEGAVSRLGLPPSAVTEALVSAWDETVFNIRRPIFRSDRSYVQGLLFNNARVALSQRARTQWANLICATLIMEQAQNAMRASLSARTPKLSEENLKKFDDWLGEHAKKKLGEYLDEFESAATRDMERNWRFKDLESSVLDYLAERETSEDDDKRTQFKDKIASLVKREVRDARRALGTVLAVQLKDLLPSEE